MREKPGDLEDIGNGHNVGSSGDRRDIGDGA
jgi:hypothetical protein